MAEALARPRVSVSDYLAFEREAEQRHELIDGEIVDMSGGTFAHSVISLNLGAELRTALRERPCTVCSPDLRVKAGELYTYADATVVCGTPVFDDRYQAAGTWLLRTLGPGDRLVLSAPGCEIAVDEMYHKAFEVPQAGRNT